MASSPHRQCRPRHSQVHGGVRYLEKAFSTISPTRAAGQLKLVFEALHERKRLLENAPHLCTALPIMTVSVQGSSEGNRSGAAEKDALRLWLEQARSCCM